MKIMTRAQITRYVSYYDISNIQILLTHLYLPGTSSYESAEMSFSCVICASFGNMQPAQPDYA
jgi:hypothetical protein